MINFLLNVYNIQIQYKSEIVKETFHKSARLRGPDNGHPVCGILNSESKLRKLNLIKEHITRVF